MNHTCYFSYKNSTNRLFKKLCVFVLGLMLLAALCPRSALAAQDSPRVIRVGYYQDNGFQEYDKISHRYSGYSYEFLMALQQYTNWTYEFVPCSFSEGLSMLEKGELDLMNNVSKTVERESVLDFTTLASGENIAYLAMKSGDSRVSYDDLDAIHTITIGLAKDSIYSERLLHYFSEVGVIPTVVWYPTRASVTEAFAAGDVDAYIVTSSTRTNEHIILSFSPDSYYIATTKGNTDIMQTLNASIVALRTNDPYFELHLKEKYYGDTTENYIILTAEEQAYLSEHPTARVVYQPNWYPLSYQDKNGEFAGAIRGVYDLLEKRTGLRFEYVPVDNESDGSFEAYDAQILAEQPADFCSDDSNDMKLTKSFVSPPLMEVSNHLLTPGDTIALVDGDYLSEVCQHLYGNEYKYAYYDTISACLDAVRTKQADGTILISYESEYYRQQRAYRSLTYTIVDEGSYSLAIAVFTDADPRLYQIVQKGLNSISTGEISNIFNNTLLSFRHEDIFSFIYQNPIPFVLALVVLVALLVGLILGQLFIRKLQQQNEIIHEKNEELHRANQATTDFFSRISHDMRTPMNGILGMATLSEDETDPAELKQDLAKIKTSGEYLLGLINDTLDFQRIESGKLQLEPELVNCNDILCNIRDMVQPAMEKKNLKLEIINKNVDLTWYIRVDAIRMKQIFINLISNAIKFTPEGGTISVEYECMKRENMISHDRFRIRDTGIGMSQDFIQNKIFKPFSQEHNQMSGQYTGSGLGLSIVKKLVDLMGGTISVESESGKSTTFTLCLDFERVNQSEVAEIAANKVDHATDVRQKLMNRNILLAEDHPLNAEIAKKMLAKMGCTVTWAKNGQECVDLFTHAAINEYDLILMDIRMPLMDGLRAAKTIRSLTRSDALTTPIIAMTANAYESDVQQALAAGMNAHLSKPIEPSEFYSTLARHLHSNSTAFSC